MHYSYKILKAEDVEILKQLLSLFAKVFEEQETYQGNIPSDDYLRNLLAKDHFIAVVALQESEVVAGLVAYTLDKFEQERKEVYIYDLAVAENHRRKGIATALIRTLKDFAKKQGAYVIFVQADQGDVPAIKLYEKLGRREDVHHFDIKTSD